MYVFKQWQYCISNFKAANEKANKFVIDINPILHTVWLNNHE